MSDEERKASEEFGALSGCFVEGDAEQRKRQKRLKRRALAISITLQAMVLAAIILIPLFGRPDRIAFASVMPLPPYYHSRAPIHTTTEHLPRPPLGDHFLLNFPTPNAPGRPSTGNPDGPEDPLSPGGPTSDGPDGPPCTAGCIDIGGKNSGPRIPDTPSENPRIVHVTQLDPAMLTWRIEPIYPKIAVQTRREGRVELHAIIGTDGTIQALQVVSGDVWFYQSAKDAVLQWRYKPTYLNNQPVEVDTTITVIYTLGH